MSAAVLTILGDASGVKRALGETVADARRASAAISAQGRVDAAARRQVLSNEGAAAREQLRQQGADRRAALAERGRQDRAALAVREKGLARETAMAKAAAANATSLEKSKTAASAKESVARIAAASRETSTKMLLADREAARGEANERRKTAGAEREGRRRTQLAEAEARANRRRLDAAERDERTRRRERAQRVGGAIGAVAGGARDFATGMDGQIQGARQRRGETDHTLNAAFYQAGPTAPSERAAMRRQVHDFADREGLNSAEVAGSLLAAQGQFNVLAPEAGETRAAALQRQLGLVTMAADSYQDPQEVLRIAGMLGQQGIRGADQRAAVMSLTGMAQAGSIELSNLSSDALGPLLQNIARSVNPTMTPEQRAAAVRNTTAETVAVGEVGSRAGLSPRDSLNSLSKFRQNLTSAASADRYAARLRHAGQGGLASKLFTTDARGNRAWRDPNLTPTQLMSALTGAFGSSTAAVNALGAGGGPGRAAMDSQQIRLYQALSGQTQGGRSIDQEVAEMKRHGADFTDARLAEGRASRLGEDRTTTTRNAEMNESALRDTNERLVGVSDAINNWKMRHPWLAQGADSGAGAGGGVVNALTGGASTALATKLLGGGGRGAPGLLSRGVGALTGRVLPVVQRALGTVAPLLGMAGGVAAGSVVGGTALGAYGSMETARTGVGADGQRVSAGERVGRGAAALGASALFAPAALISALRDLPRLFASELQQRPLVATVSPHDAGLAGAEGGGSRSMPPTP